MKIHIFGLSGSGKTTAAKALKSKLGIELIELDNLYYDADHKTNRLVEVPHEEFLRRVNTEIGKENWIIEGVYPLDEVFIAADIILWLKPTMFTSIANQWKRFILDRNQRKKYGFKNNIKLTKRILKIYFGDPNTLPDKIKNTPIRKIERDLMRYKNKLVILTSKRAINDYIEKFPLPK